MLRQLSHATEETRVGDNNQIEAAKNAFQGDSNRCWKKYRMAKKEKMPIVMAIP